MSIFTRKKREQAERAAEMVRPAEEREAQIREADEASETEFRRLAEKEAGRIANLRFPRDKRQTD
jgi:hypothetical protein